MHDFFIDNNNINEYLSEGGKFLGVVDSYQQYTSKHIINSSLINPYTFINSNYSFEQTFTENTILPGYSSLDNINIINILKNSGINIDDNICIYPYNPTFINSALYILKILYTIGFKNIHYFNYDWTALDAIYYTQNYPEWEYKEIPDFKWEQIDLSVDTNFITTKNNINKLKLIDCRSPADYNGLTNNFKVNGHVPNAVNIFWQDLFVQSTSVFKSKSEIEQLLNNAGFSKDDKDIIIMSDSCLGTGTMFTALKFILDWNNIKIYDGSWNVYQTLYQVEPSLYPIA